MGSQLPLFDDYKDTEKLKEMLKQSLEPIPIFKDNNNSLDELIPEEALLALNRNYPTSAIHVSRIIKLSADKISKGVNITREEISSELAIPWARTQGTINVMRKMELLKPNSSLTPFGQLVYQFSPFIDDHGLLWLLHYLVSSNANLVIWSYLFNQIIETKEEFTINDITPGFVSLEGRWSSKSLRTKAPKEIGGIVHSYTDDIFSPLKLIDKVDTGVYYANRNSGIIPPLIWLSILLIYRARYYPGVSALEIPLIIDANFSPGRICYRSELLVRQTLDDLHNANLLTVETRSGLDQIRFKKEINWLSAVQMYFEETLS